MVARKYSSKKKAYVKRRSTNRRSTVRGIVNSIINKKAETKKHSFAVSEQTVSTLTSPNSNNFYQPLALQNGTGLNNRIGHKVQGVGLDIRGHFYNNQSGTQSFAKMVVFRRKNMSADPESDLLETNASNVGPASQGIQKMYARFNTDDYQILKTKMFVLGSPDGAQRTKFFKCWVPLKNNFTYDGSGTAPPSYGDIMICFYSAESANDTMLGTTIECTFNSTFYFKDF